MHSQLADLLPAVAYNLTGRWITFELCHGAQYRVVGWTAVGNTRKDLDGRPVVTLQTNQTTQDFLKAYLHETAHVVLHFEKMGQSDQTPKEALTFSPALVDGSLSPMIQKYFDQQEAEAGALADKWLDYVHCHTVEWDNLAACLKVLLDAPKGEV